MAKKTIKFNKTGTQGIPNNKPVVYKIKNKNNENIYTGIAKRGRAQERITEHLPGGPDRVPGGVKVEIQQMGSIKEAGIKEANIISRSKPKYNKQGK